MLSPRGSYSRRGERRSGAHRPALDARLRVLQLGGNLDCHSDYTRRPATPWFRGSASQSGRSLTSPDPAFGLTSRFVNTPMLGNSALGNYLLSIDGQLSDLYGDRSQGGLHFREVARRAAFWPGQPMGRATFWRKSSHGNQASLQYVTQVVEEFVGHAGRRARLGA